MPKHLLVRTMYSALLVLTLLSLPASGADCSGLKAALKAELVEGIWTDMRPLSVVSTLNDGRLELDQVRAADQSGSRRGSGADKGPGEEVSGCLAVAGGRLFVEFDGRREPFRVSGSLHATVAQRVGRRVTAAGSPARRVGPTPKGGVVFEIEVT